MFEYQQKSKIRRRLYSPIVLIILLIITVALLNASWGALQKKRESDRNAERVKKELEALESQEQSLSVTIDRLQTNTGIEEEIRQKFNVAKDGEKVIIIVEPNQASTTAVEKTGFFNRLWSKFRGWFGGS